MQDSGSRVSVEETGPNDAVKVDFLLSHLNSWNCPASFLSHCVLAREVMCHSVPRRNPTMWPSSKKKKDKKQTFTMLRVAQEGNHKNTKYTGFFKVTYFGNVFQPPKAKCLKKNRV